MGTLGDGFFLFLPKILDWEALLETVARIFQTTPCSTVYMQVIIIMDGAFRTQEIDASSNRDLSVLMSVNLLSSVSLPFAIVINRERKKKSYYCKMAGHVE